MYARRGRIEPGREPLVELGPGLLRNRRVDDVANQLVPEGEALLGGGVRTDELPPDQLDELGVDVERSVRGNELADRARVEDGAFDRRELQHETLVVGQAVDPRGDQRPERRRDGQ